MARTTRVQLGGDAVRSFDGIDDLIRDLRKVDRDLPKRIQKANKRVAERVVDEARPKVKTVEGSASGSIREQAASRIRPRARQKSASVALLASNNKGRVDAFPFEFGTRFHTIPYRGGGYRRILAATMRRRVFPPWVGNRFDGGDWRDGNHGNEGHIVHPTIQAFLNRGTFVDDYMTEIDRAMRGLYD